MDESQTLEACQLMYEAYWTELGGFLNGVKIPCWNDLSAAQLAAMVLGMAEVDAYIAGLA